jgi:hypothetical protein
VEWEQKTNWYMQSAEGYRISKGSKNSPLPYAAWAPGSTAATPALAFTATAKEAMHVCEEHFNNRSKNT